MKHSLFLIAIFLFAAACSKAPGTNATLKVSVAGIVSSNFPGGLVVTGKTPKGQTFSRILTNGGSVDIALANGEWNFLAIGWDGGAALTGTPRCAVAKNQILKGGDFALSLSLTNAKCFDGTIGNTATKNGSNPKLFGDLAMAFCNVDVANLSASDYCEVDILSGQSKAQAIANYKIYLEDETGVQLTQNQCESRADANTTTTQWPVVSSDLHLPTIVKAFPKESACDESASEFIKIRAPKLRSQNGPGDEIATLQTFISNEAVCALAQTNDAQNFSSYGHGTAYSPWGICRFQQLQSLSLSGALTPGKFFVLLSDVDALPGVFIGGVSVARSGVDYGLQATSACLEKGNTLMPIGFAPAYAPAPGCAFTPAMVATFDSTFHGNGYVIKNFRYSNEDVSYVGLFAKLGASASIGHLQLDKASVRGMNFVGAAVGDVAGGSISHVTVTNSEIEGQDSVGGVIGRITALTENLVADNVTVEGAATIGGLAGEAGGIRYSRFKGAVIAQGQDAGGIAGTTVGTTYTDLLVSGYVRASSRAGGLFGSYLPAAASSVLRARFSGTVSATEGGPTSSTNREVGGLIGLINSANAVQVTESFVDGNIVYLCTAPDTDCRAGSLYGNKIGAGSFTTTKVVNRTNTVPATLGGNSSAAVVPIATALCIDTANCPWKFNGTGLYPRLVTETGDCGTGAGSNTVATQALTRGGSGQQPILLCNRSQLAELATHSSKNFKLMDWLPVLSQDYRHAVSYTGTFDGNQNALTGGLYDSAGISTPFIGTLSGSISNLSFYGGQIISVSSGLAVVAATNTSVGDINNVHVKDSRIISSDTAAGLVLLNSGSIRNSSFEGEIVSNNSMGGIVYHNAANSTLLNVYSEAYLRNYDTNGGDNVGGVAGLNEGRIENAGFGGSIYFNTSDAHAYAGGIVGHQDGSASAVTTNVYVSRDASLSFSPNGTSIGGIVGKIAAGTVTRVLFSGLFIYDDTSLFATNFIGPLAGDGTPTLSFHESNGVDNIVGSPLYTLSAPSAGTCTVTLPTYTATVPIFMENFGWQTWDSGTSNQIFNIDSPDLCTGTTGVHIYDIPVAIPFTNIASFPGDLDAPFNLLDMRDLDDAEVVYGVELDRLLGNPATTPRWVYDDHKVELMLKD